MRGGYHRCLLVGLHFCLEPLLHGYGPRLGEPRVGIAVEFGKPQRGLLLREVRLRFRKVRLCLPHTAIRIHQGLARLQLILTQRILQHCDLIVRGLRLVLRVDERSSRRILRSSHLRVVEPRDHLAGGYGVALAHGDFKNLAARFWRHGRIVAFDAPAERDDVGRQGGRGEKYLPDGERGDDHADDQKDCFDARTRGLVIRGRLRINDGGRRSSLFRGWRRLRQRAGFHFIHGVCRAPLSSNTQVKNPQCGLRCVPVGSA